MDDPQTWTLLGVFGAVFVALVGYSSHSTKASMEALATRLGARIDLSETRTAARFETLDRKIDTKYDHLAEVIGIRLDAVDHRLSVVEDDLRIVKAHLLRHPAA